MGTSGCHICLRRGELSRKAAKILAVFAFRYVEILFTIIPKKCCISLVIWYVPSTKLHSVE